MVIAACAYQMIKDLFSPRDMLVHCDIVLINEQEVYKYRGLPSLDVRPSIFYFKDYVFLTIMRFMVGLLRVPLHPAGVI